MKRSRAAPRWQTRHPEHRQPEHRLRPWSTRVFACLVRRRCDHNHQRVDPRRTPAMAGTPTPSRCPATDRETGARATRLSKPHVRSRTAMWSDGVLQDTAREHVTRRRPSPRRRSQAPGQTVSCASPWARGNSAGRQERRSESPPRARMVHPRTTRFHGRSLVRARLTRNLALGEARRLRGRGVTRRST